VVTTALAIYGNGDGLPSIEQLALLLSDELSRVPELIWGRHERATAR
jgi:hypothetical protein